MKTLRLTYLSVIIRLTVCAWCVLILSHCAEQKPPIDQAEIHQNLKEQADSMAQALIAKDFIAFARYCHPSLISQFGGEKELADYMQENRESTDIRDIVIGEPSQMVTFNSELQCTLPETIMLRVKGGRLELESALIAVSSDSGITWSFLEVSEKNLPELQTMIPTLSSDLVIPKRSEPILHPD